MGDDVLYSHILFFFSEKLKNNYFLYLFIFLNKDEKKKKGTQGYRSACNHRYHLNFLPRE